MKAKPSLSTVYVVDDELSVRDSLEILLGSINMKVVSFDSAEAFLEHYKPSESACLILDVMMPSMSGLELQTIMEERNICIPIIFISGHSGIPETAKAFRAGAVHFLEKPFDYDQLTDCIHEALKKGKSSLKEFIHKRKATLLVEQLTEREREVLLLITQGNANKDIARYLKISTRTVEAHRIHIKDKTQARSLAELTTLVIHAKLG
jgi:two-component system, LuxR family, response regulator FixJ